MRSSSIAVAALAVLATLSSGQAAEPADPSTAAVAEPGSSRHFGIMYGAGPGVLAIDLEYGYFYGFASAPLALDVFLGKDFLAGALGLGGTFKLKDPRWSFDVYLFGVPARNTIVGSSYSNPDVLLSLGIGAGFHFTSAAGYTLGLKFPVFGTTISLASKGFDNPADRAAFFYFDALMTLPVVTFGYRF